MRSNQEQALLPRWGPVPTALLLPEHHSANSAAQLGGREQGTSQADQGRPWRGITCTAGAVDEAGQGPGKQCHSPHSSNVQEGTCCLGKQKKKRVSASTSPCPQNTCAPRPEICPCSQYCWKIHSAREGGTGCWGTEQTLLWSSHHSSVCSRQDCRGRRRPCCVRQQKSRAGK